MRIPLTRYAIGEVLLFTAVYAAATAGAAFSAPWLVPVPLALWLFTLNFFRDPDRRLQGDAATIVSPADGTVSDIERVKDAPFLDGPAHRIGIFLSVFDVHVNRAPLEGEVAHLSYRPGAFLDARAERCATDNEAMDVGLEVGPAGSDRRVRVLVRQISGMIARRIVCRAKMGDRLERGQRFGMIKFGSRTELYVPERELDAFTVKVGDKVLGGATVLGHLRGGGGAGT